MTDELDRRAELLALIDALCEETITPEQLARLEALVMADPEAEATYIRAMHLHAGLLRECGVAAPRSGRGTPAMATAAVGDRPPRRLRPAAWAAVAAAALVLVAGVAGVALRGLPHASNSQAEAEATDDSVAVLTQAVRADWEETGLPTRVGAPLPPGRLRLKSGLARVEFYCGATVILEGPADFELLATDRAYCRRGKLRALVPHQAVGFTIGSPRLDLVDLGTEFGMQVGEADRTEVRVFDGEVELRGPGADRASPSRRRLTTGAGLCIDEAGVPRPVDGPSAFVSAGELAALAEAEARRRLGDWRSASEALCRDPGLLAYYTFEAAGPSWDRTLPDRAGVAGAGASRDGTIINCRRGSGRWRGKAALEFRRVSDRVRVNLPGEHDSLSLMAWVRIDGLDNPLNSLLMSDGSAVGGVHWQIEQDGTIKLGIQRTENRKFASEKYRGPVVFRPDMKSQWVHLAVVYDRAAAAVTHYVNGRPAARLPIRSHVPLRIGDAEIGNWNQALFPNSQPIRNLNGVIDEFAVFSRPLSPAEVERHALVGSPRS